MKPTALERKLGLRFKDGRLLEQALAHPSYLNELQPSPRPTESYERLEFLGDALLGVSITVELFRRCPELLEGQLTKLRSSLVKGRTLARLARGMDLGDHLKLGKGEEHTGGRSRDSNLAAALEALVGAVYLDRGFEASTKFVLSLMSQELEQLLVEGAPEDPKSRLQELVQSTGATSPPYYRLVDAAGPDHRKNFNVEVIMDGQVLGTGRGNRKLDAEKQAAEEALRRLETSAGV